MIGVDFLGGWFVESWHFHLWIDLWAASIFVTRPNAHLQLNFEGRKYGWKSSNFQKLTKINFVVGLAPLHFRKCKIIDLKTVSQKSKGTIGLINIA